MALAYFIGGLACLIVGAFLFFLVLKYIRQDNSFWYGFVPFIGMWLAIMVGFVELMSRASAGGFPPAGPFDPLIWLLEHYGHTAFAIGFAVFVFLGILDAWNTNKVLSARGSAPVPEGATGKHQLDYLALLVILFIAAVCVSGYLFFKNTGIVLASIPDIEKSAIKESEYVADEIDARRSANKLNLQLRPVFMVDLYEQDYSVQGQDQWRAELERQLEAHELTKDWKVKRVIRVHLEQRFPGRIEAIVAYEGGTRDDKPFTGLRRMADTLPPGGLEEWVKTNLLPKLIVIKELGKDGLTVASKTAPLAAVIEVPRFTIFDTVDGDYVVTP